MSRDFFETIANSEPTGGGNFLRDGKYLLAVQNIIAKRGNDGRMIIFEFQVLQAEPVVIAHPKRQPGMSVPNPPGFTASKTEKLDKHKSAPGNCYAIVLALLGKKKEELSKEQLIEILTKLCDPRQPARGMLIADETYEGSVQSGPTAGNPITKHKWMHVPGQQPADIQKRRAVIDQALAMAAVAQPQPAAPAPGFTPPAAPQWAPQAPQPPAPAWPAAPAMQPPAPTAPVPQWQGQPAAGFAPPAPTGYAPPVQAAQPQQPAQPAAPAGPPSALDFL